MTKSVLSILIFLITFPVGSAQNYFKGSLEAAINRARTENKKVLIDFYFDG
jgi:hypothetical protein